MKKMIFIFLTLLCFSCSKDDDASTSAISINPPEWVQGNWAMSGFEEEGPIFKISSNDVVYVVNNMEMSYKGQMEGLAKAGAEVSVDETISDDAYEVTFNMSQGATISYTFSKIDATTINWDNSGMEGFELIKQ